MVRVGQQAIVFFVVFAEEMKSNEGVGFRAKIYTRC